MRIVIHLTKFYDWVPVPQNVVIDPNDIASGKVMPGRDGGYRVRVVKLPPAGKATTERTCHVSEALIVQKMVHEKCDAKRAGRSFSRREAVAHLIQDHLLDDSDWSWIAGFEIDDDGPVESVAREILTPHTAAKHGKRPGNNIPPEHLEPLMARYMEPASAADHVDHVHAHFNVSKKAVP